MQPWRVVRTTRAAAVRSRGTAPTPARRRPARGSRASRVRRTHWYLSREPHHVQPAAGLPDGAAAGHARRSRGRRGVCQDAASVVAAAAQTQDGCTDGWAVSELLGKKPSGCVVVIYVERDSLNLTHYRFYGGAPGCCLPDLSGSKPAKHPKADATGTKKERKQHRRLLERRCEVVDDIEELADRLFGTQL